jgi:hypothetical protein
MGAEGIVPGGSGSATERLETVVNWKGWLMQLTGNRKAESMHIRFFAAKVILYRYVTRRFSKAGFKQ